MLLNNDSLPISSYSSFNSYGDTSHCIYTPNLQELFSMTNYGQFFTVPQIGALDLESNNIMLGFDSTKFQLIESSGNFSFSSVWSKAANLDIVQAYRNALPNSKIGIRKVVFMTYDAALNFSIPSNKYLLYFAR